MSVDPPDAAEAFLRRLTARDVQERVVALLSDVPSLSGADLSIDNPSLRDAAEQLRTNSVTTKRSAPRWATC